VRRPHPNKSNMQYGGGFGSDDEHWRPETSGLPNRPELQEATALLVLSACAADVKLISNHFDILRDT
jgi:hypothetical protein